MNLHCLDYGSVLAMDSQELLIGSRDGCSVCCPTPLKVVTEASSSSCSARSSLELLRLAVRWV